MQTINQMPFGIPLDSNEKTEEQQSRVDRFIDSYIGFLVSHRRLIMVAYVILCLVSIYFGKDAFSLSEGGFEAPHSESAIANRKMTNTLAYPDPIIAIVVESRSKLTADDVLYRNYYNQIVESIRSKTYAIKGIISYTEVPSQTRLISNDRKKTLILAQIRGEIEPSTLNSIVSVTPLTTYVGGLYIQGKEFSVKILEGVAKAEYASIPIILVLLFFALGSIVAGITPWFVAIGGVFTTLGALVGFNETFRVSSVSANIVTLFGLGLAIDYSLFIVSRFTIERKTYPHIPVNKIIKRTLLTSGKTVIVSAVTVFCALSGGLGFEQFFLTSICLAVMLVAIFSAIIANSFLYSFLAILDHNINRWPTPSSFSQAYEWATSCCTKSTTVTPASTYQESSTSKDSLHNGLFYKTGQFVVKHPIGVALACSAVLAMFTSFFFTKVKFGNTDADVLHKQSPARVVFDFLQNDFSEYGRTNVYVYIETGSSASVSSASFLNAMNTFQERVKTEVGSVTSINSMISAGFPGYSLATYIDLYANPYAPQYVNNTNIVTNLLQITDLNSSTTISFNFPFYSYSTEAKNAVRKIRSILHNSFVLSAGNSITTLKAVTGNSASVIDLYESLLRRLPIWYSILICSVFVVLLFITESLILPLKAVFMSVISLGATMGIILLLFLSNDPSTNEALGFWPTGYVDGSNLIFICSISFGLAVDYELFLLCRLIENFRISRNIEKALLDAMQQTGGTITTAAVLLAVTTFAFIANEIYFMKLIGVGIAIAVVLDATIIRVLYVPAAVILFGEYNFYCPQFLRTVIQFVGIQETNVHLEDLGKEDIAATTP